jgi:hypothetical protein
LFAREEIEERFCTVRGVIGTVEVRFGSDFRKVRRERAVRAPVTAGMPAAVSPGITEEWTPLRLNMVVGERCEIRTGPESEVRLETAEGSMIRIGENTVTEIASLHAVKKTVRRKQDVTLNARIRLNSGSVVAEIKKLLGETSDVRFETPTSTAAIRGTTVEIETRGGDAGTVIKAFDGTVEVAPAGTNRFVPLTHGKMVEVTQGQRVIIVKDVPRGYKRKSVFLKGEIPPSEDGLGAVDAETQDLAMADAAEKDAEDTDTAEVADTVVAAVPVADSVTIELGSGLGGEADTISCYVGSTITVEGVVRPANAIVNINGVPVTPNSAGVFRQTWTAPPEPGVIALTIAAENGDRVKAVVRTIKVLERKYRSAD